MDFIDTIKAERENGINRALDQSQHTAVNSRYPGTTLEYCCDCGCPTGNAGRGEDSNYTESGEGPFCWECFPEKQTEPEICPTCNGTSEGLHDGTICPVCSGSGELKIDEVE